MQQPREATPEAIVAYRKAGHTQAQTAQFFGIHERTVRKKEKAAEERVPVAVAESSALLPQRQVRRGRPPRLMHRSLRESAPVCANPRGAFPNTADDVAGDGTMWLDPWMGELMPVPPGVRRKTWEAERIAARDRHAANVAYYQKTPEPENSTPVISENDNSKSAALPAPMPAFDPALPVLQPDLVQIGPDRPIVFSPPESALLRPAHRPFAAARHDEPERPRPAALGDLAAALRPGFERFAQPTVGVLLAVVLILLCWWLG